MCHEWGVYGFGCVFIKCSAALSHCIVPLVSQTKWKYSPSSAGSFHSVTKAAGSMPWQPGLVRCWEKMSVWSPSSAPHLVRDQMSWADPGSQPSEAFVCRHIKDSHTSTFNWKTGYLNPVSIPKVLSDFHKTVIQLGKDTWKCWAPPAVGTDEQLDETCVL